MNIAPTVAPMASDTTAAADVALSSAAPTLQQPDEQGDYYQPRLRTEGSRSWQVVDPDPAGLNCRMKRDWQGITFGHANAPDDFLNPNYDAEISAWDVMTRLLPGELLRTDGGHLSQGHFVLAQNGKPWLAISIEEGTCFVRANSAFIQPQSF